MSQTNNVVLVTGAGGGAGKAIAKAYFEAGAHVFVSDLKKPEWVLNETNTNGRLLPIELNVTDEHSVQNAIKQINDTTSGINVLVNNAGISIESPIHETALNTWEKMFSVNSTGVFLCTREVVKSMLANKRKGSIINISSIAGRNAFPGAAGYCASKAAVLGFTRSLAVELGEHDITVNAICPGSVETPMIENVIENISLNTGMSKEEARKMMESGIPLKRFQKPEDVASLALFLSSEYARNITGESINLDGGVVRN